LMKRLLHRSHTPFKVDKSRIHSLGSGGKLNCDSCTRNTLSHKKPCLCRNVRFGLRFAFRAVISMFFGQKHMDTSERYHEDVSFIL
jgi:hypothetical protein